MQTNNEGDMLFSRERECV